MSADKHSLRKLSPRQARRRVHRGLDIIKKAADRGEPGAAEDLARLSKMIMEVASLTVCWQMETDPAAKDTLEAEMHRVMDAC